MSPLWRDEVAIYLAPRKLALVRRSRGLRPRVVAATVVAVPGASAANVDPVLARLRDVLSEPTWQDAAARVVVADSWSRYGIVPWPAARLDAAGRLTHARYALGDAYGETVADWTVSLADTPPGRSFVACAIPATLQGALADTLAAARLALVSLQPQLVVAFNAWRHLLPPDRAWFVSLDDGSLSAVHLSDGAWDRVHMARLSADWSVELERLQAFGRLTRPDGASDRMLVAAAAWMRRSAPPCAGVEWLEGDASDGAEVQALALQRGVSG